MTNQSLLGKPATRRAVLGGSVAAASIAVTYAALGDKLDLFGAGPSSTSPLAAGSDSDAISHESVRISHLLRRAGLGASREEHDHYQTIGLKSTIDELVNYTQIDDSEAERLAGATPTADSNAGNLSLWWLTRLANTKRPLQEKMALFWHGLITSQISVVRDPQAMLKQNEFFRTSALARFPDILKAVSADTAMAIYLNIDGSNKRAPNENYARELMELFSLGIGNYSEQDIREAARAFTGWAVPRTRRDGNLVDYGDPVFFPERFDSGTKTFLGQTGNFRPDDIIDIIVDQPASAKFITNKLFSFFVYPNPDDRTLQPFIDVYTKSDKSIGATVEALLRSDEMYSRRAYRAIVRSPVEYTVAAVKALGLQSSIAQLLAQGRGQAVTLMGQTLFEPPNVAGWPGGATWLNSATIFARLNFLNGVTGGTAQGRQNTRLQPPAASGPDLGTADQALDYYLPLVLDDNIPDDARQVLIDFAGGAGATLSAEKLRGLVYLTMASPQFHLA